MLFKLLHHRFGIRCIRIAIANMVGLTFSQWFHINFSFRYLLYLGRLIQRIPFEWKNPIGYLIAVLLQFGIWFFLDLYLACFLTLAFGYFLFTLSIAKDMIDALQSINEHLKKKKPKKRILKQLNNFISMHGDVKELS